MVICPKCEGKSGVLASRWRTKNQTTYRRRECQDCNLRWTTIEIAEDRFNGLLSAHTKLTRMLLLINETIIEGDRK